MATMSYSVWGQSQPPDRFEVTTNQVARAVSEGGVEVTEKQVSMLAKVFATEPNPALDVLTVGPLGDQWSTQHNGTHSLVKLACHLPGICLPFYVIVIRQDEPAGGATSAVSNYDADRNTGLKRNVAITMRAGAHATLVMDDDRSHIQIAVISLENGIAGHRIRVASPDHKQTYVAEVVNASLLRGSF
jgi:hypothetical protein